MAPHVHFISFGLLILSGFNVPIPEDLVLIISGSIAATIVPENKYLIFFGCFAGAYISDINAYLIGRYGGIKLIKLPFFQRIISEKKLIQIEAYFSQYGLKTLFFGRFIPFGVRNVLFFTSGLVKLNFINFLIVDFLALVTTSTILFNLGLAFGANYKELFPYIDQYKIVIFSLFISIFLILFLVKKIRKRRNN